ncbi:MAG: GntR family transcriptional regulator [Lachnospiraceae bacterium]|nr:GntR family transcriptional regulator [Lachnospiraceae bacterium]
MNITISNASGKPIYEQISEQIKAMVLSGELREGDALPSMRLLAKELRISVITTKRAYEELEREGFLISYTGKGSFIAGQNPELLREHKRREIEEHLGQAVELSRFCGVSEEEMVEILRMMYQETL